MIDIQITNLTAAHRFT